MKFILLGSFLMSCFVEGASQFVLCLFVKMPASRKQTSKDPRKT